MCKHYRQNPLRKLKGSQTPIYLHSLVFFPTFWFFRAQEQLKSTAKKLKWAATQIYSQVSQSTFGGQEFFKTLYNNLKDTQSLLTEIWDNAFSKQVIETDLEMINIPEQKILWKNAQIGVDP